MTRMLALLISAVCLLGTSACSGFSGGESADRATYDSVQALGDASDIVVRGRVGRSLGTWTDTGGSGTPDDGVAMESWTFTVEEQLAGATGVASQITVAWPDPPVRTSEERTPLEPGQQLVLFLSIVEPLAPSPGPTPDQIIHVATGGDDGVLDVDGDRLIARSEFLRRLTSDGEDSTDEQFSVSLEALRRTLGPAYPPTP